MILQKILWIIYVSLVYLVTQVKYAKTLIDWLENSKFEQR